MIKKFLISLLALATVISIVLAGCAPAATPPEAPVVNVPPPASPEPLTPETSEPPTPAPTPVVLLPKPGEWTASTGSSEFTFTFTVGSDSTGIPKYSILFTGFKCAGVQASGGWEATVSPKLPIASSQFTIEVAERGWDITIQGKFDEDCAQASGTWEISREGAICQEGSWEASAP